MKYSFLAIPILLLSSLSCQGPQSEEVSLFDSLDRLPSLLVNDAASFSLGTEHILISGKQQGISLKTIQLLSGFSAAIKTETESICLDNPDSFTKYPFASKQLFQLDNEGLEVSQLQIISKEKLGITLLYSIKNVGKSTKNIRFQFQPSVDLKPSALMDSTVGGNAPDQIIFDELTGIFTAKDQANDWYAIWGTSTDHTISPKNSDCTPEIIKHGASAGFEIPLELAANEERFVPVFIAGSDQGEYTAIETLVDLRADLQTDWDENFALVDSLQSTSKITIPGKEVQEAYEWSKFKVGLFQFEKGDINPIPIENPEELYFLLNELSQGFPEMLDRTIFTFDETKPRHIQPGWEMIQPMTLYMVGVFGDVANRVTYIRPNLPKEWKEASIENLWIDDNKLNISITSDSVKIIIEVTQTQKKAGISIELPEEFSKVKVLGKEVSSDTKDGFRRILMTGAKATIEASR
ncbi:MAG: hypothetical protein ABJ333_03100 [Algoriphagus sp.]|uniref:hypothetical protein n=1 Tax=Algoriphagus sp. TaxID=1872435 RepID=UPI0032740EA1